MVRYQFLDIKLTIAHAGIFVMVYSIVLGVPFGLAVLGQDRLVEALGRNWFWVPMTMLFTLATMGPFLYMLIRKKAEERILADELRARHLLIRVSRGMADIRDTGRLLRLIRHVLSRALRAREVRVFLKNPDGYRDTEGSPRRDLLLTGDDPLVLRLKTSQDICNADELSLSLKSGAGNAAEIAARMRGLSANIAVPLVIHDGLAGLVTLGGRFDHEPWTENILDSLRMMAGQTALAIENCRYFEAEKERLNLENAQARRESLDMLVATMAHEIDNPITGAIVQADMAKTLLEQVKNLIPPDIYAETVFALDYVNTNVWRVSKIVKAVEDYSKGGEGSLGPTSIYEVLEKYRPLQELQLKSAPQINYSEEIEPGLPGVMAETVLIEEILMNYTENALHAIRRKETDKQIRLSIKRRDGFLRLAVHDNGYGMSPEIARQVFEVPATTKASSEGTGLGLYRVRKICVILGARYGGESPGPGQGSDFWVEIPFIEDGAENGAADPAPGS
jgi:signal transduction histidine kinase